ncbi:MAG TPA: substrate-binding domain-containing protein [Alphaproteobacteria bacterium]|nr:substrate-binding domain-containing protein [Alphaproteobacteria bacterium]HQS93843.1 substrate-binding domain-containing protein [Alphaproteobacteria bacterium]
MFLQTLKAVSIALFFGGILLSQNTLRGETQHPEDFVRIVGSTAVFPFSALLSERLSLFWDLPSPIIERTGTGVGINLFCTGMTAAFPDGVNTSRPLNASERSLCQNNGVTEILEIKMGYGGIVLARTASEESAHFSLTLNDLFKALSKEVLVNGAWIPNPYQTWQDVNPELPNLPLVIFGPPPTSGIRDALREIVLDPFCSLENPQSCGLIREDGAYIEMPENSMLMIQKLENNPSALGILGYPFLDQNQDVLKGVPINGIDPMLSTILEGSYPLSRPLYFYLKVKNLQEKENLQAYLSEFMDEAVWGEDGVLVEKGLIPLKEEEKMKIREDVSRVLEKKSDASDTIL